MKKSAWIILGLASCAVISVAGESSKCALLACYITRMGPRDCQMDVADHRNFSCWQELWTTGAHRLLASLFKVHVKAQDVDVWASYV
jgi:hypothetical protein